MKDKFFKDNEELCKALTGKSIAEIEKELKPTTKEHEIHS
jgi:hypothetical protein